MKELERLKNKLEKDLSDANEMYRKAEIGSVERAFWAGVRNRLEITLLIIIQG